MRHLSVSLLVILLLLLFILPETAAQSAWAYESEQLTMRINLSSDLKLEKKGSGAFINYVTADLLFFPQEDWRQAVTQLKITPSAEMQSNKIHFSWENPKEDKLQLGVGATVSARNDYKKITSKIPFPLARIPPEYTKYAEPSENIDSDDPGIIGKARELAEGEDDLYTVVHKIASWVENNIEYSLNTLTAEVSQKSSWVMENRQGVCDELSSLFIAMLRSLNIPARFISGVAYTDWNDINGWGPHAWVEVYFPEKGWVPFDITYGQFGYVDASHILLKVSEDSKSTSTEFEWKGNNVELDAEKLDIDVALAEAGVASTNVVEITITPEKPRVSLGSYQLLEAQVKNSIGYYVPVELTLAETSGLEIVDNKKKHVLLAPLEQKNVFWIVRVAFNLSERYIYTFPVSVFTEKNMSASSNFSASVNDPSYSLSDIKKIQSFAAVSSIPSALSLLCSADKEVIYKNEQAIIQCRISNNVNTEISDAQLCIQKTCRAVSVAAGSSTTEVLEMPFAAIGRKELVASLESDVVNAIDYVDLNVLDKPTIAVTQLSYPKSVRYDDAFPVSFTLEQQFAPKEVNVAMGRNDAVQEWHFDRLLNDHEFVLDFIGSDLQAGANKISIIVDYLDNNGEKYHVQDAFYITLENLTVLQKMRLFFKSLSTGIGKLIKK